MRKQPTRLLQNETATMAKTYQHPQIHTCYICYITAQCLRNQSQCKTRTEPASPTSVSEFRSTNSSRKKRKGCAQFFVYTLLAAQFLLLVDSSWLLPPLASPQPCALLLPACSSACHGPFPLSFPPPPERYKY